MSAPPLPSTSALQLNRCISTLRLTNNNIPDEGICALAETLARHETVTEVGKQQLQQQQQWRQELQAGARAWQPGGACPLMA